MPDESPGLPAYHDVEPERADGPFDEHAGKMVGGFIKIGKSMGKFKPNALKAKPTKAPRAKLKRKHK